MESQNSTLRKILFSFIVMIACSFYAKAQTYNAIVAQDGSGNYTTIGAALDAAPANSTTSWVIYVKSGTYNEKDTVAATKTNIVLIGQNVANTILTHNDNANTPIAGGGTLGTSGSFTLLVQGNNFTAINMSFENTSGINAGQAVAVYVKADGASFKSCRFLGFQDTLYTGSTGTREYFNNCYIEGTVDYIFGGGDVIFDSCNLYCKNRSTGNIVAPNNTSTDTGYVFRNCSINGNAPAGSFTLGRPWQNNPKSVFLNCSMSNVITDTGWSASSAGSATSANTYFAEYQSTNYSGSLINVSKRVSWSYQLSSTQAASYTDSSVYTVSGASPATWNPCSTYGSPCVSAASAIAVSNFIATKGTTSSTITWNISWPMTGITYNLFRSVNNGPFSNIGTVTSTDDTTFNFQLTDTVPPAGSAYYYYLVASKTGLTTDTTTTIEVSSLPTITVTGTLGSFIQSIYPPAAPSAAQTYTVSGVNLVDSVRITPQAPFEVSKDNTTWYDSTMTLALAETSGTLSATTIYVRLNGTTAGTYYDSIVHTTTGTGANTVKLPVSGTITTQQLITSVILQQWPLDISNADSAGVRSAAVTASTPAFNNLYSSTGTTVPAYSAKYGQAFGADAAGTGVWSLVGGTLKRTYYEQFTVTAAAGYSARIDSLILDAAFYNTSSKTYLAIVYSFSGFRKDSTDFPGAAFAIPDTLPNMTAGPSGHIIHLAINGGYGDTLTTGDTLTFRLYFTCGSSSAGRYGMLENVIVKGLAIPSSALPLTLLSFDGAYNNNQVKLAWATTNEVNSKDFVIERSADGKLFTDLSQENAADISGVNNYSYTDESPLAGVSYYRLKVVDIDGSYVYSNVISVNAQAEDLLTVYPNPATSVIKVTLPKIATNGAVLSVVSINGKRIATYPLAAGTVQTEINVSSLPAGSYLLMLENGNQKTTTLFVKTAN